MKIIRAKNSPQNQEILFFVFLLVSGPTEEKNLKFLVEILQYTKHFFGATGRYICSHWAIK
jgi:hypothetical protein